MENTYMKKTLLTLGFLSTSLLAHDALITVESQFSFNKTTNHFVQTVKKAGIKHFATINHAKEAKKVKLTMNPTKVVIFGNPKMGTVLMNCAPLMAIDLPLKMLVSENNGTVSMTYTDPDYYINKYHITDETCVTLLGELKQKLETLTTKIAGTPPARKPVEKPVTKDITPTPVATPSE